MYRMASRPAEASRLNSTNDPVERAVQGVRLPACNPAKAACPPERQVAQGMPPNAMGFSPGRGRISRVAAEVRTDKRGHMSITQARAEDCTSHEAADRVAGFRCHTDCSLPRALIEQRKPSTHSGSQRPPKADVVARPQSGHGEGRSAGADCLGARTGRAPRPIDGVRVDIGI